VSTGVLIMARAPRPGEVKTRLEPLLGPDGCARLQAELVHHTAAWAASCARDAWLAFTPASAREDFARLVPASVTLFAQEGGNLGERLRDATELVFRRHRGALAVIGTDAPELGPVHLRFAERALAGGHDACLIPALDGGYALIALARSLPQVFELPPAAWGGPDVLELTLLALADAGCSYALLQPVRDVDTPEDATYVAADPRCPRTISQALKARTPAAG
jgi:rSAM/selenodomain-associated transferase 1